MDFGSSLDLEVCCDASMDLAHLDWLIVVSIGKVGKYCASNWPVALIIWMLKCSIVGAKRCIMFCKLIFICLVTNLCAKNIFETTQECREALHKLGLKFYKA